MGNCHINVDVLYNATFGGIVESPIPKCWSMYIKFGHLD